MGKGDGTANKWWKAPLWAIGRLLFGAAFVVATIAVWRVYMAATWWAGRDLVWRVPAGCTPTDPDGFWARLRHALFGYNECAPLHWTFALLLLGLAIWTGMRAFFPPEYPPERYPVPAGADSGGGGAGGEESRIAASDVPVRQAG